MGFGFGGGTRTVDGPNRLRTTHSVCLFQSALFNQHDHSTCTLFPIITEADPRILKDSTPLEKDPVRCHDCWRVDTH